MASPHVAGALALLLEQQPTIDVAQAKSLLAQSANTTPLTNSRAATTWGAGKLEVGPGVLTLTPASGPPAGGGTIHITGVDLQPGVTMSLGGRPLTLTSTGTNSWSATVPPSTGAGAAALTITNPDRSTAVDPSAYVYLDPTGVSRNHAVPHMRHPVCLDHTAESVQGKASRLRWHAERSDHRGSGAGRISLRRGQFDRDQ